jgi:hypothetical protein
VPQAQDQGRQCCSFPPSEILVLILRQCDEGKPGCKRCAQIRKPCPGYPFQVQLQIRSTSGSPPEASTSPCILSGPVLPPHHPATTLSQQFDNVDQQDKVKLESAANKAALNRLAPAHRAISPPPRYDIQHQSLCFFLNLFCFQAGRLYAVPVLDFLPELIQNAAPYSCLKQAAMAVSRMTLADQYSGKDVRLLTGKDYGYALKLANATIRDTAASIQDETVVAVWLLGLYEVGATPSHVMEV